MFLMVKLPVYGNIFRIPASTHLHTCMNTSFFSTGFYPLDMRYRLFRLHEMLGRVSFVSWGKCVPVRYDTYILVLALHWMCQGFCWLALIRSSLYVSFLESIQHTRCPIFVSKAWEQGSRASQIFFVLLHLF